MLNAQCSSSRKAGSCPTRNHYRVNPTPTYVVVPRHAAERQQQAAAEKARRAKEQARLAEEKAAREREEQLARQEAARLEAQRQAQLAAKQDAVQAAKQAQAKALQLVQAAQKSFREQDYAKASSIMDDVLKLQPKSSSAYQFRALIHFAGKDYDQAAADVYDTLLRGPIWQWETIRSLYESRDEYVRQYTELARAAAKDDDSMSKHFLLGYHHLALGHLGEGQKELARVLEIQPNEPLTTKFLAAVEKQQKAKQVASN